VSLLFLQNTARADDPMVKSHNTGNSAVAAAVILVGLIVLPWKAGALPPRDYYEGGSGWDEGSLARAFDPSARRSGNPAEGLSSGGLAQTSLRVRRDSLRGPEIVGNASFGITVPIVHLPGRGLDLALDLTYNSLLWQKYQNDIVFDRDGDWPAPGWSLGFGKWFISALAACLSMLMARNTLSSLSNGRANMYCSRFSKQRLRE
jgi:hypothetical protein